ncbi:uncharacterized protein LOC133199029 isoform X1 [Saccostrea echinata]|uniref:uncharacterized protein LOC133199029 isoform X1 n=1 Tax=Saccostrea echinata TaxID=191078 RepID=UPI002A835963|nr:uncharacterized protein LOC133199029 isoform X1 [Saccostrea echinata]
MMEYKRLPDETFILSDHFHQTLEPCLEPVLNFLSLNEYCDQPVNIVDFGTCDGQAITPFLKILIGKIRAKPISGEIAVFFNDQKTNDFNALVKTITVFKEEMNDPLLRIFINPSNAYGRCLPESSIDIGISTFMVHWVSTPIRLEKDLIYLPGKSENKEVIEKAAAQDWKNFLSVRSREMKKGAVFLCIVLYYATELAEILCDEFHQLYERNIITKEELSNTTLPSYPYRTESELRAPFDDIGQQIGIQLLELRKRPVRSCENKDIVGNVRLWLFCTLMAGLGKTRNDKEAGEICNTYFENLRDRLSDWNYIDFFVFDVIFQKM